MLWVRSISRSRTVGSCLVVLVLAIVGCSSANSSANSSAKGASQRYSSAYPKSIFGNLSGQIVYYDTGGGTAWNAWQSAIVNNFQSLTGVQTVDDPNQGDTKFYAAEQAGNVPWSLVLNATIADGKVAEQKGYLQPLDTSIVPVNDLQPGTYDKYGVYAASYGFVLTWNTKKWPLSGPHPTSMADLYNVSKFPGKRCMYDYPEYGWTLESALIADGVPLDKLYPLDVNRALAKLDTIKQDIVWWSTGGQSVQDFQNGSCDIGIVWSGRVYAAVTQDHQPLAMTWNQGGWVSCLLGIPKGAPNPQAAQAFLRMLVLDHSANVALANAISYPTVVGQSGVAMTSFSKEARPYVTFGSNLKLATAENDSYYESTMSSLLPEFTKWQAS